MSIHITTAFVKQYANNVDILSQQRGSKLQAHVRVESVNAEYAYFEQIGATVAQVKSSRHSDTPLVNTEHMRRRVGLVDYEWADLIDHADKVRLLIDPQNPYALNASHAFGRAKDDAIITAAFGTAYTGKEGGTATSFPVSATRTDPTSGGMTINALKDAKLFFDNADVDESLPRYIVCSPHQINQLLGTTQVTSADYNTVKALVQGEVDSFMGFKFIWMTRLPKTGHTRDCLAYVEDGLLLGIGADEKGAKARISERDDKSYSIQVFNAMSIGATRMDEDKVYKIQCVEA